MAESTSTLQAKLLALTHGKVDIMLDEDTFKSTTQILREMAGAWEEMTDIEAAAALELMGGKRQANILASVIKNFDVVEDVIATSMGSEGSALKENEKYLDSIQGKLDQFNNSTQTMWMNFMNADVVKFFVELATSVVKAADDIGLLQIAVAAFFAKTAFNADSFGQFFKLDVNDVTGQIEHFGFSLKGATKNAKGLSIGTKAAAVGTQLLNSALTMGISLLASWAIEAFIGWLDETIVTADELREKVEELTDTYKTAKKEFSENLDTLTISSDSSKYKTLADEFEELAKGVNAYGENISLTSDEYERYRSICEAIVGVNPSIAEGYDSATKAIGNNAGALRQLIELQKEQARLASAEYVSYGAYAQNGNFENIAKNAINEFNDAYKATGKYINGEQSIVDKLSDLIWPDYFEITDYGIAETSEDDFAQSIMRAIGYNPDKINEILASYSSDELGFELDLWASDYTSEIVKNRKKIAKELENMDVDYLAGETFQSQKTFIEKVLKDAKYTKKQISNAMQEYYTDDGTFDFKAFKLGIADAENGVTYGEILTTYVENHVESALDIWNELADGYEDVDKTLQSAQNSMLDTFLQVPYALREYEELSTSEQSFIADWIKNGQMFKIDESTTQDEINAAKQTIINMVRAIAGEDYKASIKDKNGNVINVGLDVVLDTMANIDASKGTYLQYKTAIEENVNALWTAIEKDAAKFGFANKRDLAVQLGYEFAFEEETKDDNTDKLVARIAELTGESEKAIREYMDGLPPIKVTRAIEYYLNGNYDDVQGNTDDNKFTVSDAFNLPSQSGVTSVDINTVQTYTALSEKASSYNDILTQTNEITADNMEITQEYKDSLSDLGFTTEELSECFDENNDLIVKNSKRLRELVAEKKKAAAADVKLAKAQSRLEYYQLVDELNETLNVKRDLTDAEQEAIDSTLKQLKVVERAIYKYQLLEDSLLGATNAFEDFAQAKEVDALNTYGDSYVEMVQTMYNGIYKTGQVGTEAFWSAVEHLVPITEYAHLTEDADRMKAIISYFNKNIAPTLTLKDDAFSIDFDAVENFVEQGIANGVFNKDGTTGKFNLVEGMNLEEAATLMKMTTAQAYAFFAELDKYNISGNEHSFLSQLDQSTEGKIMRATTELENLNKQKNALLRSGGYAENREEIEAINDKLKEQEQTLDALEAKSVEVWQNYSQVDSAIAALDKISDKEKELSSEEAAKFGIEIDKNATITVEEALKRLEEQKANLEKPTVLTAQLAQEQIQSQLADLETELGKDRYVTIKGQMEQDENGQWVIKANADLSEDDKKYAKQIAALMNADQDLTEFLQTGMTVTETYLQSIDGTLKSILTQLGGKSTGGKDNNAGGEGDGDGNNATTNADNSGTERENNVASRKQKPKFVPLLYKDGATLDAHDYSDTGGSVLAPGQPYVDPSVQPGDDGPFAHPAELTPGTPEFKRRQNQLAKQSGGGDNNGAGPLEDGHETDNGRREHNPIASFVQWWGNFVKPETKAFDEEYEPEAQPEALPAPSPTPTPTPETTETVVEANEVVVNGAVDGPSTDPFAEALLYKQQMYAGKVVQDVETGAVLPIKDDLNNVAQQIREEYKQANVDLLNRQKVSWVDMNEADWNTPNGSYSTVDTVTFNSSEFGLTDADGNDYAINVTPILPNGKVIKGGEDGLAQYINEQLDQGKKMEHLDVFLGNYDTIDEAVTAAQRLHELQATYYDLQEEVESNPIKPNVELNEVEELLSSLGLAGLGLEKAFTNGSVAGFNPVIFAQLLQDSEYAKGQIEALIGKVQEYKLSVLEKDADPLGLNTAGANIDSLMQSLDDLGVKYSKVDFTLNPATWFDGQSEIKINVADLVGTLQSNGWTSEAIKAYCQQLSESANIEGASINIEGIENIDAELDAINQKQIDGKNVDVKVTGADDAEDELKTINALSGDVRKTVTTTYKTEYKTVGSNTVRTPGSGGRYTESMVAVNGTAHAQGTAHKGGSWGAPKTEIALTAELGPELRVRGNKWELLGEHGAEFNEVKKGDIIFNHKQTEELLTSGYITGRGKAFAEGTVGGAAYSGLLKPASPDSSLSNTAGTELSAAAGKLSDAADDVKEIFDWIEVRLEEINEDISLKSAELENAVGLSAQNAVIDDMIALNKQLYDNLIAGADKYDAYAQKLLTKIPEEYRKAAQNGSIAIEEFVGEVDEETLNAIQEYREWVQKGADVTQQAEETLTEISNLAKQAIDNIAQDYENKTSFGNSRIEQLEAFNALTETDLGYESASIYQAMIEENNRNIAILQDQRNAMLAELNKRVESGEIKRGSQDWYDAINEIAAVDTEIINLKTDTENYQDAINDLHWDKFDSLINRLQSVSEEAENLIDILGNSDLVDEAGNWTDEGIASLGLYAQQMEAAEVEAKKYQDEIDYLNNNWQKLGYTEEEYLERLGELKDGQYAAIQSYHKSKDAIVDMTKARVDAIKKGIDKEIEAYEELISKKKEELDSEKDLYDFQKNVSGQQKNIAELKRKIAALSSDNSASARAQRAQLEAELAEAEQELSDTYYDRSVSNQQEALDKELESFREEKDKEKEGWDEYLENTNQVVADGLATVQANTATVYKVLKDMGKEYGLSITESLTSPWQAGKDAIDSFTGKFGDSMSATVGELKELETAFIQTMANIELSGKDAAETVKDNFNEYTEAEKKTNKPSDNGQDGSSAAGLVSSLSGDIQYGQSGANVKKLQKALNALGFNCGSVDGIFGDKTYAAVLAFQKSSKFGGAITADGIVGTNTKKKFKVAGYAGGTTGVKNSQFALIDELGEELVIRPSKGKMTFLEKGSGVVPADLTANLMEWGELDPSIMLERNKPVISAPHVTNNNVEINMEFGEVVHIDTVTNDTIPNLTKAIEKQMDKYMKNVNNNIRKYTR